MEKEILKIKNLNCRLTLIVLVTVLLGFIEYNENEATFVYVLSETTEEIHKDIMSKNISDTQYLKGIAEIGGVVINIDIALTDKQKQDGLSIRDTMQENEGMIFVFKEPKQQSFWMKGMKFPIDIIWLDANLSIVHIEKNLQTCESFISCPSYRPSSNALFVLETVSGFADNHDLKIGKKINFKLSE